MPFGKSNQLVGIQPQFIYQSELSAYGLPDPTDEPKIISYVQKASSLIDSHCGRINQDGYGSLVWTTYGERILLPEGRNIGRCSYKPLVAIDATTYANYSASGSASGSLATNLLAPNTQMSSDSVRLSPFIAITGRYGYGRRGTQNLYPDANYGANILQIASMFGGPPQFTPITITNTDFDPVTGEFWVPAGIYLSAYSEVFMLYNSGFPPDNLPNGVKNACAMVVHNFLATPATNLRGFGVGSIHHEFQDQLITPDIQKLLMPFVQVIAM